MDWDTPEPDERAQQWICPYCERATYDVPEESPELYCEGWRDEVQEARKTCQRFQQKIDDLNVENSDLRLLVHDLRKALREVYDSAWYVQNGEALVCRYCDEPSFVGEAFRHKPYCTIREVKRVLRATKDFADD